MRTVQPDCFNPKRRENGSVDAPVRFFIINIGETKKDADFIYNILFKVSSASIRYELAFFVHEFFLR